MSNINLLDKALNFISYCPRTEHEVRKRLVQYKAPQEKIDETVEKVRGLGLLDDELYAETYVQSRILSGKPFNYARLKQYLFKKGVSGGITDGVLAVLDKEIVVQSAFSSAEKRLKIYLAHKDPHPFLKVRRYLYQQGFAPDAVDTVVDRLTNVK